MKALNIFIVFVIFCLSGCAGTAGFKQNLSVIESDNYILIEQDIAYEEKRGIGILWKEGLKKGKYKPELANERGTFYRGPEGCVEQFMGDTSMGPFDGGIWIPKDKINDLPRIYYYFNYNKASAQAGGGIIIGAILESQKGDITFMPAIKDSQFRDKLQVTNL